jgi:delta(3,5)-delta(2,4)-dienoyl-CoA isomerase
VIGNDSLFRELCFTARNFTAQEALSFGLVSKVCKDRAEAVDAAVETAALIASKSPVAVARYAYPSP